MDIENKHPQFDAGVFITAENITDVAEWCNGRIAGPWGGNPRLHVKTGFSEDPNFVVEVKIGDKMEKTEDGKFQVWINPNSRSSDLVWDEPRRVKINQPEHYYHGCFGRITDEFEEKYAVTFSIAGTDTSTHLFEKKWVELLEPSGAPKEDRPEMLVSDEFDPQGDARRLVHKMFYVGKIPLYDVYVVWFCKTLQNWKCMISTNAKDNAYYEVTYNGDKNETYVDRYLKDVNAVAHGNTGMIDMTKIDNFDL